MIKLIKTSLIAIALVALVAPNLQAQNTIEEQLLNEFRALRRSVEGISRTFDQVIKRVDDLMWREMVGDIAHVDKVRLTGPARVSEPDPNNKFATNPVQFASYVIIPRSVDPNKKYPLIVLPHDGASGGFSTFYAHIVRELIAQEYIVIAAEYRNGTGGATNEVGLENDDILASRDHMVDTYPIVDPTRVGIMGWSRGGMLSMMGVLTYADKYNCAFAGVPVPDPLNQFASPVVTSNSGAPNQIVPQRNAGRTPSNFAENLNKPLLIHTNMNGEEVYVKEMQSMVDALRRHNKTFEYKVLEDFSGGESTNWIDAGKNTEIRYGIHKFLEKYLNPPKPFKSHADMRKAAYRFN